MMEHLLIVVNVHQEHTQIQMVNLHVNLVKMVIIVQVGQIILHVHEELKEQAKERKMRQKDVHNA